MALNTSEYIWNPATCIITADRFAYYGSFSFLKLPLKLLRMILEYLFDKAIVKLPQGKVIKAAHEWDTSPRAPAAQAPRRGPSGQTNAHIMQCSKHMSDVARTILYAKRIYTVTYLNSIEKFRETIGDETYSKIRHLELPLARCETATHISDLLVLANLNTLVLTCACPLNKKTASPLLTDAMSWNLHESQEPLSIV